MAHGKLKPGNFTVPAGLLSLFREKASHAAMAMESISPSQFAKIDNHVMQNVDQFRSMVADAEMFGEQAVIREG